MTKKIAAIIFIFICTSAAWMLLGGAMTIRTEDQDVLLKGRVVSLWGKPQKQKAPTLEFDKTSMRSVDVINNGKLEKEMREFVETFPAPLTSSKINVDLDLEHRKKGLLWYSTYRVVFSGDYSFTNTEAESLDFRFRYEFPAADGIYDSFIVSIDGKNLPDIEATNGEIKCPVRLKPGQSCSMHVSYESQGLDEWWYEFGKDVTQIRDFDLNMTTDFEDFDFPENSMSPSSLQNTGGGAKLNWHYSNLLSGAQIGMAMPQKINPAITDEYQAVVLKCLQKKPENRYQNADELITDLQAIKTGAMHQSALANFNGTGAEERAFQALGATCWSVKHIKAVPAGSGMHPRLVLHLQTFGDEAAAKARMARFHDGVKDLPELAKAYPLRAGFRI